MSLQTRLESLASAIGADVKSINTALAAAGIVDDPFEIKAPNWTVAPISNSANAPVVYGTSISTVGTATTSGGTGVTSPAARIPRVLYRTTASATNGIASLRQPGSMMGPIRSDGWGGFRCLLTFGPDLGTNISTDQFFMGVRSFGTTPTAVNPSTLGSIVGLGYDNTDANVMIMHNDDTGTATKIDTGWPVPTTNSTEMYKLELSSSPTEGTVLYRATRYDLGLSQTVTGTITTDLPANDLHLNTFSYHSTGTTSTLVGIALGVCYGIYNLA